PTLHTATVMGAGLDWKTSLQELAAGRGLTPPSYHVSGEGPDHQRVFTAQVVMSGDTYGSGVGPAKKVAEQRAAEHAYRTLSQARDTEG
ncbi:MAG: putative dsRNA-binding protein, partial [Micrococcales bacterium]|nr:putative dsRNA-binding protein [Micrococcales bacterium]